jgi:multiple sugar transport system ATP-binding protein
MARVQLEGVTKVFDGGTVAVQRTDLAIEDREFLILVGPSGCGKSTLLRVIAGLEEATEGTVRIDGEDVTRLSPKDRDVAMVFQNYALYPHMTAYDNLAFGLKLRRFPKDEIDRRVREAAGILEIEPLLARKPAALSGGQRQRVAVGRAIVRHPKAFLFDEPLSNLDANLRVQMRREISRLHRRLGATMIYVTHDQIEAMTMGERIAVMRAGRIHQVADPLTIYHRPADRFVASFIGSPAMNFFDGTLERSDGGLRFVAEGASVRIPSPYAERLAPRAGGATALGVRPEDLTPRARGEAGDLTMMLEVLEPTGSESYLSGPVGRTPVVCRGPADAGHAVGESVALGIAFERAHWFDGATGANLLHGGGGS